MRNTFRNKPAAAIMKMSQSGLSDAIRMLAILTSTIIMLTISSGLNSCQKVINIDLNSAAPQVVVEANISDAPGPYFVKLSESVSFDEITQIPPVTGAIVEISDSTAGTNETLTEVQPGTYATASFRGIQGHRFRLTITTGRQVYEAASSMPYNVGINNLTINKEVETELSFGGGSGGQTIHYRVNYEINDPAEYNNYYRFVVWHKDRKISSRRVFSDQFHNGRVIADYFSIRDTTGLYPGDTVRIELQNIDKNTYNFFRTLREGASGMNFLSASPSNPISNISNSGLGYFSAGSVSEGYVIIPD